MLFEAAKLIGIRGYYWMRKADLVEELYALHRDPQRVPRTITRVYYKKTPDPNMEAIPRRHIKRCIHGRQSYICKECKELGVGIKAFANIEAKGTIARNAKHLE